jgi:hypothetical protein
MVGYFSNLFSNFINDVEKPFTKAYSKTMDGINGMSSCLQFPIYQSDNTLITIGLDPFAIGVSAKFNHKIGDVVFSGSAGWGYYNNFFANAGITYNSGDWSIGGSIGIGKNYWGWYVNTTYQGWGFGYGRTYYGNAIGPDKLSNKQTVGSFSVIWPNGSFSIQNDFLANNGDKWRTSAWELTIGNFSLGSSIYTNDGENASDGKTKNVPSPLFGPHSKKGRAMGAWSIGQVHFSPLWIGMRIGNTVSRFGYSHKRIQDITQNFVHTKGFMFLPFGYQNYYLDYDYFQSGPYFYSGYYNPYSLW